MALADRDGLPLSIVIADGSRHDSVLTDRTLDAAHVEELPPRLIADKAWDGQALQDRLLAERGIELIAPKKKRSRRKQDGRSLRRYRRRWKVERLFAWLKRWRRLACRSECSESAVQCYSCAGSAENGYEIRSSFTAAETALEGANNIELGELQANWFEEVTSGNFALENAPAGLANAAQWQQGDPATDVDVDGDLRPTDDGVMNYAGADVPQ